MELKAGLNEQAREAYKKVKKEYQDKVLEDAVVSWFPTYVDSFFLVASWLYHVLLHVCLAISKTLHRVRM